MSLSECVFGTCHPGGHRKEGLALQKGFEETFFSKARWHSLGQAGERAMSCEPFKGPSSSRLALVVFPSSPMSLCFQG